MRVVLICFACFGIFVAGAISGGLVVARSMHSVAHTRAAEQFIHQQFREVADQLDLTPAERERIRPIIQGAARQMQERRREVLTILEHMDEEIRAQLTPAQQTQYDVIRAQQRDLERQNRALREQRFRRLRSVPPGAPAQPGDANAR